MPTYDVLRCFMYCFTGFVYITFLNSFAL